MAQVDDEQLLHLVKYTHTEVLLGPGNAVAIRDSTLEKSSQKLNEFLMPYSDNIY